MPAPVFRQHVQVTEAADFLRHRQPIGIEILFCQYPDKPAAHAGFSALEASVSHAAVEKI